MRLSPLYVVAFVVPSLVACVIDSRNDPPPSASPLPTPSPTAPAQPMVVTVDTNQVMNAKGGDGVGVFVEYKAGGHWKVWMTCDSNKSNLDCDFDVKASAASIHNAVTTPGTSTSMTLAQTQGTGTVEASVLMTTDVNGFTFDTDPSARITIDATVSGIHTGDFFFWVQDGKVNGGYGGHLTNPLSFESSQP